MINLFFGPVVNPHTLTHYSAHPQCLIAVGLDGNIIWIEEEIDLSFVHKVIADRGLKDGEYNLVDFSSNPGEFLMPGMIDTHVHACQFPNLGIGGDLELIDWLFRYTYPTEKKFADNAYAKRVYNDVVDRSIASGTTTSCYYGSLHLDATITLADIVWKKGQRAFVGKCNMDWDCPDDYIDPSADVSLEETIKLINHIQHLSPTPGNERLVRPIITPRFALSCSDRLLIKLGELAASLPCVSIQTHICENRREVRDVLKRFDATSYAEVYDRFGLLRENTILGHGVWLTEKDMELIAARGAGVAHCPTSNFYLGSGMAKVGALLDHGIKVGLGTDVAGGYNPSILYTVQMASTASKMVSLQSELDEERCREGHGHCKCHQHGKHEENGKRGQHEKNGNDVDDRSSSSSGLELVGEANHSRNHDRHGPHERHEHCHCHHPHHHPHHHHRHHHHCHPPANQGRFTNQKLDIATLFYLATLGGAHVCNLQDRVGSFAVGKAFDALYVSLDDAFKNPAVWGEGVDRGEQAWTERNLRRWLERFLFCGDNRNVRRVYVQGVEIGGADVRCDGNDF